MLEIKSVGIVSPRNSKPRKRTTCIAVHCSATGPEQDVGAREIDRWHRAQGWACIGYHYVIRRDGALEAGRPLDQTGAHCQGKNTGSIGICLVGGIEKTPEGKTVSRANYTAAQYQTLGRLVRELHARFPGAEIRGHQDFANKACPCFDVAAWWKEVGHAG